MLATHIVENYQTIVDIFRQIILFQNILIQMNLDRYYFSNFFPSSFDSSGSIVIKISIEFGVVEF